MRLLHAHSSCLKVAAQGHLTVQRMRLAAIKPDHVFTPARAPVPALHLPPGAGLSTEPCGPLHPPWATSAGADHSPPLSNPCRPLRPRLWPDAVLSSGVEQGPQDGSRGCTSGCTANCRSEVRVERQHVREHAIRPYGICLRCRPSIASHVGRLASGMVRRASENFHHNFISHITAYLEGDGQ